MDGLIVVVGGCGSFQKFTRWFWVTVSDFMTVVDALESYLWFFEQ